MCKSGRGKGISHINPPKIEMSYAYFLIQMFSLGGSDGRNQLVRRLVWKPKAKSEYICHVRGQGFLVFIRAANTSIYSVFIGVYSAH